MKYNFLFCLFLISLSASAQKFEITGTIVDQEEGLPLESATVFVERIADSALVSYTITNNDGTFVLEGSESSDSLRLVGSYAGYDPLKQVVRLDQQKIDLGTLEMGVANNVLGEITVVSNRAPVTVKADTLEFNADSFHTREGANLEEVMKKLPGVEVDSQGSITVHGKPVSRILVNGKEFFGNDPLIATRNLPKEIINKIQVVDTKTKQQEFTGEAGDPDNKTINITIKEDKNKGYFARATVGGGTDERYEMSGIVNYFQDELRVSALASSNNINSSGFSSDEIFDAMGRRSGRAILRGGGGRGITKSESAGLNFTNEWEDDKYELDGDYLFGRNDNVTHREVQRENFLPDRTYYSNSVSGGNYQNDSHRANASFEIEPDTLTRISIRPSINIDEGVSNSSGVEETFDEYRDLTNSSVTRNNGTRHSSNFDNRVNFIRRFGSRGAFLQANFSNRHSKSENESHFESERITYDEGVEKVTTQDQLIDQDDNSDRYSFGISQRSVLSDDLFLDLSYDFSSDNSENIRNVYDLNESTGEYNGYNEELSNAFEVNSLKHIPNVGINYEGEKWELGFDVGLLNTILKNENFIEETSFDRSFNNLYINSNIRYEMKRGTSARISYRSNTHIPSIHQMQPVVDRTNPLNIVEGNPELRPTYTHSFNLDFHNFDYATRSGFGSYASANFEEDEVVRVTLTDEDLVRSTTFTNVDGSMNANLGAYYNKTFKKDSLELRLRLHGNGRYNKDIGFSNAVKFASNEYSLGGSVGLGLNYKEKIDINPRYNLNYVFSDYSIETRNREENYMNHSIGFDATTYWPENFFVGNDLSYNYFGSVAATGFDPTAILWNISMGYQFLDEDATIKFKVYDLLNENVSTSRSIGQDYVQDTQELILEQYFMLSFTYKLSQFGGRDANARGGRGRGRW